MTLKTENPVSEELVEKTFEKLLFPTPIYSFKEPKLQTEELNTQFFELCSKRLENMSGLNLLDDEAECI